MYQEMYASLSQIAATDTELAEKIAMNLYEKIAGRPITETRKRKMEMSRSAKAQQKAGVAARQAQAQARLNPPANEVATQGKAGLASKVNGAKDAVVGAAGNAGKAIGGAADSAVKAIGGAAGQAGAAAGNAANAVKGLPMPAKAALGVAGLAGVAGAGYAAGNAHKKKVASDNIYQDILAEKIASEMIEKIAGRQGRRIYEDVPVSISRAMGENPGYANADEDIYDYYTKMYEVNPEKADAFLKSIEDSMYANADPSVQQFHKDFEYANEHVGRSTGKGMSYGALGGAALGGILGGTAARNVGGVIGGAGLGVIPGLITGGLIGHGQGLKNHTDGLDGYTQDDVDAHTQALIDETIAKAKNLNDQRYNVSKSSDPVFSNAYDELAHEQAMQQRINSAVRKGRDSYK